jgi:hypothetical protein
MRCQNRHAPIGGCLVHRKPDNERQEETRLKVIDLPETSILKNGNFVALKKMKKT